jgi:hypothetical protein
MTETNTRHEAIVTPSSSLLRTIVSTMGTLTFTSVASFYYYYYRPNTMTHEKSIGVVLFQSVASLWGWPTKKKQLSSEKRRRKKSKSPGRKRKEFSDTDNEANDKDTKEAELKAQNGVFDAISDHALENVENRDESTKRDVCVKLFDNSNDANYSKEIDTSEKSSYLETDEVTCEDASEEDCSDCHKLARCGEESGHENVEKDGVAQNTKSACGMQELAFEGTAHVVESSSSVASRNEEDVALNLLSQAVVLDEEEHTADDEVPAYNDELDITGVEVFACDDVPVTADELNLVAEDKRTAGTEVPARDDKVSSTVEEEQIIDAAVFASEEELTGTDQQADAHNVLVERTEMIEEEQTAEAKVSTDEDTLVSFCCCTEKQVDDESWHEQVTIKADLISEINSDVSVREDEKKNDILASNQSFHIAVGQASDTDKHSTRVLLGKDDDESSCSDHIGPIEAHAGDQSNLKRGSENDADPLESERNTIVQEMDSDVLDEANAVASVVDKDRHQVETNQAVTHENESGCTNVPLSFEMNPTICCENTKPLTFAANDTIGEVVDGSNASECIVDEDLAVVTDDEVFRCVSESHFSEYVYQAEAENDEVSCGIDYREEESEDNTAHDIIDPNAKALYDQESVNDAHVDASSTPVDPPQDEDCEPTLHVNDSTHIREVDDDIPDILQLDTLTFEDTSVADDDDALTEMKLSSFSVSTPRDSVSKDITSRSGRFIGKMSILFLCGGVLLLRRSCPQNDSELRTEPSKPCVRESSETSTILMESNGGVFIREAVIESAQEEIVPFNVSFLSEPRPIFEFESFCTNSETGVASPIFQGVFEHDSISVEPLNVTYVAEDTAIFDFDTTDTFSGIGDASTILPVFFHAATTEAVCASYVANQTSIFDSVPASAALSSMSEDRLVSVRKRLQQWISELSKPSLLRLHQLVLGTRKFATMPIKVDIKQLLSEHLMAILKDVEQATLGPFGLHDESLAFDTETSTLPLQIRLKQVLSVICEPLDLSETTKDALLISHGILSKSLISSPIRASITKLLLRIAQSLNLPDHTKMQAALQQMLNEVREPLKLSKIAKEAFQVSHGVGFKTLILSPTTVNAEPLLRMIFSSVQMSDRARETVLASHGLYAAPMTLFPEQLYLLKLLAELLDTAKETTTFQLKSIPSLSVQRLTQQVLVMACLTTKFPPQAREAFMAFHRLRSEDLAPTDALIKEAVTKLFEIVHRTLLTAYLDMLSRVPEQKLALRQLTSNLVVAAGNANSGLREWYSESLATTAAVRLNIRAFLSEASSNLASDEIKQAALGFHGQYYSNHGFKSDVNAGDKNMLFIELWSTLASCSYFLDHSVVLWGKVGDEALNLLDHTRSS